MKQLNNNLCPQPATAAPGGARSSRNKRAASLVLALWVGSLLPAAAQTYTQTIPLQVGWNAIHLKVTPEVNDIGKVFTNLPVESVWAYLDKTSTAEFIKNQNELPWDNPGWRRFIPAPDPRSFLTTLFSVRANQAYLVRVTNAATLIVTGRPSVETIQWVPNAFNLRGFPVDGDDPPQFGAFFAPSAAHDGQPIYQLNPDGQWLLVSSPDLMDPNQAYWVYSQGASTFTAPLQLTLPTGDGLDFGTELAVLSLRAVNLRSESATFELENFGDLNPLFLRVQDANLGAPWQPVGAAVEHTLDPEQRVEHSLGIRRSAISGDTYERVLYLDDAAGTRYLIPLSASKLVPLPGGQAAVPQVGLWVGEVRLTNVSEPHSGTIVTNISPEGYVELSRTNTTLVPTPTPAEFQLRLILHVDAAGNTRLLKEVIQLWQDGTYTNVITPNPANPSQMLTLRGVDTPGHYVLLTDDSKIQNFKAAALKDGKPVGRRISSVMFDFLGDSLLMSGQFVGEQSLEVTNELAFDFQTNPYRHKFHPDHTNGFAIKRVIHLELSSLPLLPTTDIGYGRDVMDGNYQETITGLHRQPLVASGPVRLNRIAYSPELNPQPNP